MNFSAVINSGTSTLSRSIAVQKTATPNTNRPTRVQRLCSLDVPPKTTLPKKANVRRALTEVVCESPESDRIYSTKFDLTRQPGVPQSPSSQSDVFEEYYTATSRLFTENTKTQHIIWICRWFRKVRNRTANPLVPNATLHAPYRSPAPPQSSLLNITHHPRVLNNWRKLSLSVVM